MIRSRFEPTTTFLNNVSAGLDVGYVARFVSFPTIQVHFIKHNEKIYTLRQQTTPDAFKYQSNAITVYLIILKFLCRCHHGVEQDCTCTHSIKYSFTMFFNDEKIFLSLERRNFFLFLGYG